MSRIIATLFGEGYRSDIIEEIDLRVHFMGDADICADGAFRAYHPVSGKGLDDLSNAHSGNNWYGCVTVGGSPVRQGPNDPAPGFYVSATSLHLPGPDGRPLAATNPRRYVDAESVPFIVVPPQIVRGVAGVVLGCKSRVTDTRTSRVVDTVVADVGPYSKDGEISIAAAKALGIPSSARTGGEDKPVFLYELFPGIAAVVNGITYPLQGSHSAA